MSVSSETTSRVITLSVTGKDAEGVARVANAIAEEVSEVAQNVQMAQSVNVIDRADAPTSPSGPNRTLYVAVAFLAGLFAAVAIIVLIDMLNTAALRMPRTSLASLSLAVSRFLRTVGNPWR